nr:Wzt carbohydrate-binding domain-containing protein [Ardenticatenales bacterium]
PESNPLIGLAIHRADGTHINGPNNRFGGLELGMVEGDGTISYTIPDLPLMSGFYDLTVAIYDTTGSHAFDVHSHAYQFQISAGGTQEQYGILCIPGQWEQHSTQDRTSTPDTKSAVVARV